MLNTGINSPASSTLVAAANALLRDTSIQGEIETPTPASADFADRAGQFDLSDIGVLLATARIDAEPLTSEAIAAGLTALLGGQSFTATDILSIPGSTPTPTPSSSPSPDPTFAFNAIASRQSAAPGQTVEISILLEDVQAFSGLMKALIFDSHQLCATSIVEGEAIKANGRSFTSNVTSNPVGFPSNFSAARTIIFGADKVTDPVLGTIAVIQLEVLADAIPGNVNLTLEGQVDEVDLETRSNLITIEIGP